MYWKFSCFRGSNRLKLKIIKIHFLSLKPFDLLLQIKSKMHLWVAKIISELTSLLLKWVALNLTYGVLVDLFNNLRQINQIWESDLTKHTRLIFVKTEQRSKFHTYITINLNRISNWPMIFTHDKLTNRNWYSRNFCDLKKYHQM